MRKALIIIGFVLLAGCEKREDFPPMLPITPPPAPSDVNIEKIGPALYEMDWNIVDPDSVVSYYRVYGEGFFGPEFIDSTQVKRVLVDVVVPVQGTLVLGVSSVSNQNVESAIVFQMAPDSITTASRLRQ